MPDQPYRDPCCILATADPDHTCRRRDGVPLTPDMGDCWVWAHANAQAHRPYGPPRQAAAEAAAMNLLHRVGRYLEQFDLVRDDADINSMTMNALNVTLDHLRDGAYLFRLVSIIAGWDAHITVPTETVA